ncbi:alcohol acetyltransferase [Alkalibacterium putridalgicola]|uniref:alcohol acetyltransferase n=1 Tax=Alkalibacterium putridalgicola TaxID=426703 RepID=UPI0034CD7011
MEKKKWVRLDNASNIFLAARNETDTKVFRLSAEMTEVVDPVLLQSALQETYKEYPLFHNVLRRGIFWYYLEERRGTPKVKLETEPPCSPLYHYDKREFLFRVLYYKDRIHLEVFHALTDGTGALWFYEDLLTEYVRLRQAKVLKSLDKPASREKADLEDSFKRYFRKKKKYTAIEASMEPLEKYRDKDLADDEEPLEPEPESSSVYRIKGKKTPDHRQRVIEMSLPLKEVLDLARSEKVSLTLYMTTLYMLAVYRAKEDKSEDVTISTSIPINLRQFFPSVSVRNFFSTTIVSYTFKPDKDDYLDDLYEKLTRQFKAQLQKEALEKRLNRFIRFEFNPLTRITPRPLKDGMLKLVNYFNNKNITVAMSNLGRVQLPEGMEQYVKQTFFYTAAVRPQFCLISYQDVLTISFTSPFVETDIHREFVRLLTEKNVKVTMDVNRVSREEMNGK